MSAEAMSAQELERMKRFDAEMRKRFGVKWPPLMPEPPGTEPKAAAEGVGAGAEDPSPGQKNRGTSAAARAPEGPETEPEIPERLKTKPNKRENEFMLNLMVLRNTLLKNAPACRERAGLAGKWVWRDIRLMTVLVCRIQEALLRTMPKSRDEYYTAYARHGHYELHLDGPIRTARHLLITDKHLATICEAAMESECLLCMREGNEIDRCELRDALMEAAVPTEIRDGDSPFRRCEYRDAAGQLIRGKEVTI